MALPEASIPVLDAKIKERIDKGRARHKIWKPVWAESLAFVEGRQFVYRAKMGGQAVINELSTSEGDSKPRYRARTVRNRVLGYYLSEVSMGTQRVPQYEVTPSTTDPTDIHAASLSEKVLIYLYDFLSIRKTLVEAYGYSVSCGEGFVRPYWDATVGEELPQGIGPDGNPEPSLYSGEICLQAFGPQEVFWAPGAAFEDSPFHCIETAMTMDQVKNLPGFIAGTELRPDARGNDSFVAGQLSKTQTAGDLVIVTEYLELPSKANKLGLRLIVANDKPVCAREPYPAIVRGPKGVEPCILKMPFIPTPWRDRDMGLVEHLIDPQRTINDTVNKAIEWKNLAIKPQMLAPVNSLRDELTDEPGAIFKYNPVMGLKPEWRTVPPIPGELFSMRDQAVEDMEEISSQRNLPPGITSGIAVSALVEKDNNRRQFIVQALADFHARLGRMLLSLVQTYYTEPRLLPIQGRHGLEYIPDFKGAALREQLAVNVLPGSIEPRTRHAIEQKILNYAQMGWISGEKAMAAIEGGTADTLVEDYELDVSKQEREINQMIALGNDRTPGGDVPIAKPYDNHDVHLGVLHQWQKTFEYEKEPPQVQEAATLHEQQHMQLKAQAEAQAAQAQAQAAAGLGMQNASRPQVGKAMPSQPALPGGTPPGQAGSPNTPGH